MYLTTRGLCIAYEAFWASDLLVSPTKTHIIHALLVVTLLLAKRICGIPRKILHAYAVFCQRWLTQEGFIVELMCKSHLRDFVITGLEVCTVWSVAGSSTGTIAGIAQAAHVVVVAGFVVAS